MGNHTVHGVRITDAEGKPYTLGLVSGTNRLDRATGQRVALNLELELHPDRDGHGAPTTATFWGSYVRTVEVPVTLRNVLLSRGK